MKREFWYWGCSSFYFDLKACFYNSITRKGKKCPNLVIEKEPSSTKVGEQHQTKTWLIAIIDYGSY